MIEVDNKFSQYTLYIRRTEHSSVSNRVDTQWRKGEAKSTDCLKPETSIEHSTKRLLPYLGKKKFTEYDCASLLSTEVGKV